MSDSPAPAVPGEAPLPARSIALLALAAFASAANLRITDPLLPQVSADFGVSVGTASIMVTGYTIAYGLLQALYGPVGDRFGKYATIAVTTLVSAVATFACAFAPTLSMLTVARFATAAASCAVIPLAMAWVGDVVPYARRQAILSRFISGQISGMIFGQAVGGVLGDLIGWRMVFVVLAAVYVAASAALVVQMRRDPLTRQAANPDAELHPLVVFRQFAALVRRPWVRVVLLTVCAEGIFFFGSFAYIGNELHHRFDLSFTAVGLAMTAYGAGGLVYASLASRLVVRIGERGLALTGGAILAVGFVLLALSPTVWLAVVAIGVSGLGFYFLHNTLQTNGTQMVPEARGAGVALFASFLFIGQSIGVGVAAPVVDRFGAGPIFWTSALVLPAVALYFRNRLAFRP